jgi:hypothetical protein
MKSLNEQLKDLYVTKFREGSPCFLQQLREKRRHENSKEQPAYPLLLKIDEDRYQEADLKIMIFGQETNSWEHKVSDKLVPLEESESIIENTVNVFMNHYSCFLSEKLNKRGIDSPFWIANKKIFNGLKGKKFEILWNNVYKIGNKLTDQNRPHSTIRELENNYFDVIAEEIKILKPNVLVFFTGPNYETRVQKKFKIISTQGLSASVSNEALAKLTLENGITSYRTYHPNYLQQKKKDYLKLIIDEIKAGIHIK